MFGATRATISIVEDIRPGDGAVGRRSDRRSQPSSLPDVGRPASDSQEIADNGRSIKRTVRLPFPSIRRSSDKYSLRTLSLQRRSCRWARTRPTKSTVGMKRDRFPYRIRRTQGRQERHMPSDFSLRCRSDGFDPRDHRRDCQRRTVLVSRTVAGLIVGAKLPLIDARVESRSCTLCRSARSGGTGRTYVLTERLSAFGRRGAEGGDVIGHPIVGVGRLRERVGQTAQALKNDLRNRRIGCTLAPSFRDYLSADLL